MSRARTKNEARKVVEKYSDELKKAKFPFRAIFLFGSYAKGEAKKWSDIDVAIVSDIFEKDREKNEELAWRIRRKVDSMIEPVVFTRGDFENDADPMVSEIKKTGVKIK